MLELEEALGKILHAVQALPAESILLADAAGRVLAEKIISEIDLPSFDNSAVDGYAVRANDLVSASPAQSASLRLIGKIAAGESFSGELFSGQCVRIFTGSPVPAGADAVAMQEDIQVDPQNSSRIVFLDPIKPWENIRFRGEDIKSGATLAEPGARLGAGHLALLGAVGIKRIRVSRQPVVGLLATGSELREANESERGIYSASSIESRSGLKSALPSQTLLPGQIFESNRSALAALAKKSGAHPKLFPLVADTLPATLTTLEKAFSECDAVVTTGGVSVGELDFVKDAFVQLGGQLDFWKISLKPGKPFVFGHLGDKFLFGLPGNPVSAFVTFILLVSPALAKMQGARNFSWPTHPGILAERLENQGKRRHFVRVFVDEKGDVRSAGIQASHILSSFARANGLVDVPPETTLSTGTIVPVVRWEI